MSRLSKTSALVAHTPERFAIDVERASLLLAACRDVPAARDVRDKAKAAAIYLRAKKAGLAAQNDAREVMLRAERRMAELLPTGDERAKGTRLRAGEKIPRPDASKTTLADLGIDKDEAKRLRQHRAVDDSAFEAHVRAVREAGEKLTLAKVAPPSGSSAAGYDGDESYTPIEIIEDARAVMGGIDLDPFSCAIAQQRIGARIHYTRAQNALTRPWKGRTWFQPPYSQPLMDQAVEKLILALGGADASHNVDECIALTNAATDTKWWHALARIAPAHVQTEGRINFDQPDGRGGVRATKANRYAQTFFYFGENRGRFVERFEKHGTVFVPWPTRGLG